MVTLSKVLETRQTALCFALSLVDHFTGNAGLVGDTRVAIMPSDRQGFLNPSGYHVFMGLSETVFTVHIRNRCYLDLDLTVDTSTLDPGLPLVTTILHPRYLYPFPPGSTLITGRVTDSDQQPLAGVQLAVTGSTAANTSDPDGRFVLYFKALTEDDIQIQNKRRLIDINDSTTLQLSVQCAGYQSRSISIGPLDEASTMLVQEPIVLTPA